VRDAHQRRVRQAVRDEIVQPLLARLVERGRRLVQEQPVGLVQERARDREPLLLAAGELQAPVLDVLEPFCQPRQIDIDERRPNRLVAEVG